MSSLHRDRMDPNYKEDEDVSLERQRVISGEANNDLIVLYCLKKVENIYIYIYIYIYICCILYQGPLLYLSTELVML